MLCDGCQKEVMRAIVARSGVPVNALAYGCSTFYQEKDGNWRSGCDTEEIIDIIEKWSIPKKYNRDD